MKTLKSLVFFLFSFSAFAQEFTWVTEEKFDYAFSFKEGLAAIKTESKWGYIDKTGRMVIEPQFEEAFYFSEGLAPVSIGKFFGFIDKNGKFEINPRFEKVGYFSEGLAYFKKNEKYGFIDKTSTIVISPTFDAVSDFSEGLAGVCFDGSCGFIDKSGTILIKPIYKEVKIFSEGLALVKYDEYHWGFIDKTGKIVIPVKTAFTVDYGQTKGYKMSSQFRYASGFIEGLAFIVTEDETHVFVDHAGKVKINIGEEHILNDFHEGLASTKEGYINQQGKLVIKGSFAVGRSFSEGLAAVKMGEKDKGYINSEGKYITGESWGFIDKTGNYKISLQFQEVNDFSEEIACVKVKGKWGYIFNPLTHTPASSNNRNQNTPANNQSSSDNTTISVTVPRIWAVVVGVSDYKNPGITDLKYAKADALLFADFLKSPKGGAIPAERISILTNEQATRSNIIQSLTKTFYQAFDTDMIVFYIASHGQPDPVGSEMYFLSYDAEPTNPEGSAVSQLDVQKIISRSRAGKKIIIADACHSGGIGTDLANRAGNDAALINKLLEQVAYASDGTAMISASSSTEYSYEDAKFGGGHGVFTHFLVEALNGKADTNKNGLVTLREIYEYVYRQVAASTNSKQHPELKGKFDNNLPLSAIK